MKIRKALSGQGLLKFISRAFKNIPDVRQEGKIKHTLHDALMGGFGIFVLKSPSLLTYGRAVDSNLKRIFGLGSIPSDTQLREILDEVDPQKLRPIYKTLFNLAQRGKILKEFEYYQGHMVMAWDGAGYFSSEKVHCEQCLVK